MLIGENLDIREVKEITTDDKKSIMNFLQGAVYCWCKNRKDEWFSLRDLMGGDNYDWQGTPLIVLYENMKLRIKIILQRKQAKMQVGY